MAKIIVVFRRDSTAAQREETKKYYQSCLKNMKFEKEYLNSRQEWEHIYDFNESFAATIQPHHSCATSWIMQFDAAKQ